MNTTVISTRIQLLGPLITVTLYERNYMEHYLVSINEIVCLSCAVSSVDVPCVSDVSFRFNVFLFYNIEDKIHI